MECHTAYCVPHLILPMKPGKTSVSTTCPHYLTGLFNLEASISEVVEECEELLPPEGFSDLLGKFIASSEGEIGFRQDNGNTFAYSVSSNGGSLKVVNTDGDLTLVTFEGRQLDKLRSRHILLNLFHQLTPLARSTFCPIFDIEKIGEIDENAPVVSGDLDGSTVRSIVLGISTGMIDINEAGLKILAMLLNHEAETLRKLNLASDLGLLFFFQSREKLQSGLQELAPLLIFKPGHTLFISIGDGAHDRFSCDKDIDLLIREALFEQGAIFITGNHDLFQRRHFELNKAEDLKCALSFGHFAKNKTEDKDWEIHQDKVFVNSYYHEATNTLYIHNGLAKDEYDNIVTAFGTEAYILPSDGRQFDPHDFVQWINRQPRPRPESLVGDDDYETNLDLDDRLTDFRPNETLMQQLARELGIRIVHGHTGTWDVTSDDVIVLNARMAGSEQNGHLTMFAVVANQIGR